ncbi:oligopeptide transporter 1-like [Rhodamnia argentea]|uniref:Oligopeptide transporter 1-like n=1 Tax=Rhodamnia argentea TaxID=178133 RepID=A0ABM3HR72_9MYRT|nr:oligopeptide transporter 1-like [Rhodamnia argentea]
MKTEEKPILNQDINVEPSKDVDFGLKDSGMKPTDIPNDSPIEEVRNGVPVTDDPTLPVLTIRTWVLGPLVCAVTSFMYQISTYRKSQMWVSESCAQILLLVLGRLLASTLPAKIVGIPGTNWKFSLNPGPFNIKEHALLVILSTTGFESVQSISTLDAIKVVYHKHISLLAAILMIMTSQMMGYGFAGLFRRLLVDNPYMWYPLIVPKVSFYRALHDKEPRARGRLSGFQILIICAAFVFAYTIVPMYFMQIISVLSVLCWFWKDSVAVHQLGAGYYGLGLGSLALDWDSATAYVGNPLILPRFAIVNILVGFVAIMYVCIPLGYGMNLFDAKRFPIFDSYSYDYSGNEYDITRVFGEDLKLNEQAYGEYSKLYMSIGYVFKLGFTFAALTGTVTYFLLFHGRESWQQLKQSRKSGSKSGDIHNELMKKYEPIPRWWFYVIVVLMVGLGIANCEFFGHEFQLPTWAFLLSLAIPSIFILPLGLIEATTGTYLGLRVVAELCIGYLYPGRPITSFTFPAYVQSTKMHALTFLAEFKLGHYMKIPPKSMFLVQIFGSLLSSSVKLGTAWWALTSVENICDKDKLPKGSMWTCPGIQNSLTDSLVWGGLGPARIFTSGSYAKVYYFFLVGVAGPLAVWLAARAFPGKKWIRLINFPVIFMSASFLFPAQPVHYWTFFAVAGAFHLVGRRLAKGWWARHVYDVSNGLELGAAFFAVLLALCFGFSEVQGPYWWGRDFESFCPLRTCPTAPGVVVEGCPVF